MSLRRFDLNLLTIFNVLIEERNVTRSAEKLAMSQPAVSHALNRLRQQLDDPILIKAGDGMLVSPRAQEIHADIHQALAQIEKSISPQPSFDPKTDQREFSIAATDHVETLILPPLLTRIQQQAPGIELSIEHPPSDLPLDELENGTIDIAICSNTASTAVPKRFNSQRLLQDGYLCAVANDHPIANKSLTLEKYLTLDHLIVAPAKSRQLVSKQLFSNMERVPRAVANMRHFLAALHATSESGVILTGPALLLKKFQRAFDLHLMPAPFELPTTKIDMVWHEFKSNDPGINWLKTQIEEIAAAIPLQHQ